MTVINKFRTWKNNFKGIILKRIRNKIFQKKHNLGGKKKKFGF